MLFNSLQFLYVFLPVTYVGFWALKGTTQRHIWLTVTGYVFYATWNYKFCALMAFSTVVSYLAGRILANRMYRFFQNDRILPNPYARNASVRRLGNGTEMLFFSGEREGGDASRPVDATYWVWLERELRSDGFQLIVLLVPDKSTVYEPLLLGREAKNRPGSDYLDRLQRSLSSAGLPVVNLKNVFQAQAARELPSNSYLYWLDDTHWNGRGMRIAAEEIDTAVRRQKLVAPDGSSSSPKPAD